MLYTNTKLIEKYGSLELQLILEKYIGKRIGNWLGVHHVAEGLRKTGADSEIVKEFIEIHENNI